MIKTKNTGKKIRLDIALPEKDHNTFNRICNQIFDEIPMRRKVKELVLEFNKKYGPKLKK